MVRFGTGHVSDAFKRYMLPDKNEAIQASIAVQKVQSKSDPPLIHHLKTKKAAKQLL